MFTNIGIADQRADGSGNNAARQPAQNIQVGHWLFQAHAFREIGCS